VRTGRDGGFSRVHRPMPAGGREGEIGDSPRQRGPGESLRADQGKVGRFCVGRTLMMRLISQTPMKMPPTPPSAVLTI
jgi:hypothetical protein